MSNATTIHQHLQLLAEERMLAEEHGLTANAAYMADLDSEIEATRAAYIGTAVTEIASLRAQIDGPLQG